MRKGLCLFLFCLLSAGLFGAVLVKDGVAQAEVIVHGNFSIPIERYAAKELIDHIKLVSGVELPLVNSSTPGRVHIYIGQVTRLKTKGKAANLGMIRVSGDTVEFGGVDGDGEELNFRTSAGTLFAVYDFLERELGIRWLWPGESGIRVIHKDTIEVADCEVTVEPPMGGAGWRQYYDPNQWSDKEAAAKFKKDETVWLRRHRFAAVENFGYGHAYTDYWQRYGESNPEFFNLLPDGTRRPDGGYAGGRSEFVAMCVTNEGFVKKVVENWQLEDPKGMINANENDTNGKCMCENCLAADESDNPARVKSAKDKFESGDRNWQVELGSLTDRYAKFYLALQKEGDKINPNCRVIGDIYANYSDPPKHTRLNDRIILRFCPPLMYPWTAEKVQKFKDYWKAWTDAGVKLLLRPNFTLDGHNFPLAYYRDFADCFDYAYPRNMVGVDMDSLNGVYGANGLTMYVIASKVGSCGRKQLADLEDDYFSAFGAASDVMRKYMAMIEDATHAYQQSSSGRGDMVGGNYTHFYTDAGKVYSQKFFAEAFDYLDEARALTAADSDTYGKVMFVWTGMMDAKMTLDVQQAAERFEADKSDANRRSLGKAYRALKEFRAAHERIGYLNMYWIGMCENHWGPWGKFLAY